MLTFRRATADDAPALRSLAEQIWREYYPAIIGTAQVDYMLPLMYSEDTIRAEMAEGIVWELAVIDGRSIGFLSITADEDGRAKLNKLYLAPELHGQGHGRALIARSLEIAHSFGASELWLQVNKRNERALRAYERAGFTRIKEAVFDIGGGYVMDDYVLARTVDYGSRLTV